MHMLVKVDFDVPAHEHKMQRVVLHERFLFLGTEAREHGGPVFEFDGVSMSNIWLEIVVGISRHCCGPLAALEYAGRAGLLRFIAQPGCDVIFIARNANPYTAKFSLRMRAVSLEG